MILVAETIKREQNRIKYMLDVYNNRLASLPKGTITESHVGDRTYYYLKYRDGKKIVSQYITEEEKLNLAPMIDERRHVEAMIKSLKQEFKFSEKALGKLK